MRFPLMDKSKKENIENNSKEIICKKTKNNNISKDISSSKSVVVKIPKRNSLEDSIFKKQCISSFMDSYNGNDNSLDNNILIQNDNGMLKIDTNISNKDMENDKSILSKENPIDYNSVNYKENCIDYYSVNEINLFLIKYMKSFDDKIRDKMIQIF